MTPAQAARSDLRCSAYARASGLDPVGSAGTYHGYLLVEHPLPWPREFSDLETLDALRPALVEAARSGAPYRVQGLVAGRQGGGDQARLVHYRRPDGAFSGYVREEFEVPLADVGRLGHDLLAGEAAGWSGARLDGDGPGEAVRDFLVCTHGSRDVCCGKAGMPVYQALHDRHPDVRVWRTSHTGGHRYAPTAIAFPEGQFWAYLDGEMAAQVVDRSEPVASLAAHYRGASSLAGGALQAAEREAFARHGWEWLGWARDGRELEPADGSAPARVRIEYTAPDGRSGAYEATVSTARKVPVLDCGRPPEEATKTCDEYRVEAFDEVAA